eukprot:gene22449-26927_t
MLPEPDRPVLRVRFPNRPHLAVHDLQVCVSPRGRRRRFGRQSPWSDSFEDVHPLIGEFTEDQFSGLGDRPGATATRSTDRGPTTLGRTKFSPPDLVTDVSSTLDRMPTCSQISCSDRRSPRSVRGCNLLAGGHRSTIANGACDTVPDNALAQWWNHVTREHTRTRPPPSAAARAGAVVEAPERPVRNPWTGTRACRPSKGILSARRAIVTRYELVPGFPELDVDDIYLGNGVSELITMTMQALLNNGDEVLIPAPDYPLWTAMTSLSGGTPVHYLCDEANDWNPDIADIESKITDKTKALLVINPNNPTGAVYSMEVLQQLVDLARKHQLLLL